jgi:hypothetical protein
VKTLWTTTGIIAAFALLGVSCSPIQTKTATKPPVPAQPSTTASISLDVTSSVDPTTVPPTTATPAPPTPPPPTAAPAPAPAPVPPPTIHQQQVAAAPARSGSSSGFQACVAVRESGNGSGSSNIYGFLQSTWSSLGLSGSPGSASRAQQDAAFAMLYAKDGKAPWSPYDHC